MARQKTIDPAVNFHGLPRQRWPAPPTKPTPTGGLREAKIAFRLSHDLRQQVKALADVDRIPVSSWVERTIRQEVERRVTLREAERIYRMSLPEPSPEPRRFKRFVYAS